MEPKTFVVRQSPRFSSAAIAGSVFAALFLVYGGPIMAPLTWVICMSLGWNIDVFIIWLVETILVWLAITFLMWGVGHRRGRLYRSR